MQSTRSVIGKSLLMLFILLNGIVGRAESSTTNFPWSRIVMIGASASAGFTLAEPFGGTNTLKDRLSYYVDAAIKSPHPPVDNLAHAMFFLNPDGAGPMQINRALQDQPTLVIGVDFLFWFCYGKGATDEERLQHFNRGLKLLEAIKCPLVVGDIPDASHATNTGILSPSQVPSGDVLSAANQRLQEWANARPNVVVVPLAHFMRTAMANEALELRGHTIAAGKSRAILQNDLLHPNARGAAILALGILDELTKKFPRFSEDDIRWNPADVFTIGYEAARPPSTDSVKQINSSPAIAK